jgi:hypothetical protein
MKAILREALCQANPPGNGDGQTRLFRWRDQKTLISFNLYGDPLAQPVASRRVSKSVRYQSNPVTDFHTVCERTTAAEMATPLPAEVIASVRRVVAHHLPGMVDARLTLVHPRAVCAGVGHHCPTSQLEHPDCPSDLRASGVVGNPEPAARASAVAWQSKNRSKIDEAW